MMFAHTSLDFPIELEENQAGVLVIENSHFMAEFVNKLKFQLETKEGDFVLSEKLKIFDFEKSVQLIIDIFSLDFNSKKILNKIYSGLSSVAYDSEYYGTSLEILASMEKYIADLTDNSDIELKYEVPDIQSVFKAFDIRVSMHYESTAEKLIDYISLMGEVLNVRCFIFVNLHSFLNVDELRELYKFAFYKKYCIISIDSHIEEKTECEKIYTVDSDMCSIF